MPVIQSSLCPSGRRSQRMPLRRRPQRIPQPRCKLDTPARLIAPAHSLTLPSLEGIQDQFEFSVGCDAALPLARALIGKGLLCEAHLRDATSPIQALEAALKDIVDNNHRGARDAFNVTLCITDRLEDYQRANDILFFIWNNAIDPQYIPLRPIFEKLEGNPHRESLMASVYQWLYQPASRIFDAFGIDEATNVYRWRKECYTESRENGDDVDLEGEVEFADPTKVVSYIRDSKKLMLAGKKAQDAIRSIGDGRLRSAMANAYGMYKASQAIKLPAMSQHCRQIMDDAAYYIDAYPVPALGISHWRDDPIVAWFDEFCQEQFESGTASRAPIILCFRPKDTRFFLRIIEALPGLVRTVAGLSEWVNFASELENECNYGDRQQA
jgi:hypothetical protein